MSSLPSFRLQSLWLLLGLAIALYWQGLDGGFVWDDRMYLADNPAFVQRSLLDIAAFFRYPEIRFIDFLPLRDWLLVAQYRLFGLQPAGYHAFSLLLYLALIALSWRLTGRLLQRLYPRREAVTLQRATLIAVVLFVVHPLHVEAVAWVSGQKELLYSLLILLSANLFLDHFDSGRAISTRLIFGVFCYWLAFLGKLTALGAMVFIPLLWLLFVYRPGQSIGRALGCWLLINLPVLAWGGYARHLFDDAVVGWSSGLGLVDRLIVALRILGEHTQLLLWPWPLSFGYPFERQPLVDADFWTGAALLGLALVVALLRWRSIFNLGFAVLLLFLLPALQLLAEIDNAMIFDRYLFLPLLGVAWWAAGLYLEVTAYMRRVVLVVVLATVLGHALLTLRYVPTYASDVQSLSHAYRHFPDWDRVAFDYVYALLEAGELARAERVIAQEPSFDQPAWVRPYFQGWLALRRGNTRQAIRHLYLASRLTRQAGHYPFADLHLARGLARLGRVDSARRILRDMIAVGDAQPLEQIKARRLLRSLQH